MVVVVDVDDVVVDAATDDVVLEVVDVVLGGDAGAAVVDAPEAVAGSAPESVSVAQAPSASNVAAASACVRRVVRRAIRWPMVGPILHHRPAPAACTTDTTTAHAA